MSTSTTPHSPSPPPPEGTSTLWLVTQEGVPLRLGGAYVLVSARLWFAARAAARAHLGPFAGPCELVPYRPAAEPLTPCVTLEAA